MTLQDASVYICIIKNGAIVSSTTIMTIGEWLAEHESKIRSMAITVKIAHTCILITTVIFSRVKQLFGYCWLTFILLTNKLGLLVRCQSIIHFSLIGVRCRSW